MTEEDVERLRARMRAWRERQHEAAVRYRNRSRRTRNDSAWREECIEAYGDRCVVCGAREVEMDHIIPRSQGGTSVVENGLPLCGPWSGSVRDGHHGQKTAGTLKIRYEWLTAAQREYLADLRWVAWDENGQPFGRGFRHFAPLDTDAPPASCEKALGARSVRGANDS